jgi:hypothetical protein
MFKIAQNEANFRKNNTTYKALRYCLETLSKKNVPPTFSHGKGKWGKSLRTTINEGIVITNFQKSIHTLQNNVHML